MVSAGEAFLICWTASTFMIRSEERHRRGHGIVVNAAEEACMNPRAFVKAGRCEPGRNSVTAQLRIPVCLCLRQREVAERFSQARVVARVTNMICASGIQNQAVSRKASDEPVVDIGPAGPGARAGVVAVGNPLTDRTRSAARNCPASPATAPDRAAPEG